MDFIIRHKKFILWVAVIVIGFSVYNALKVNFCKVDGCPREVYSGEKYCHIHKCSNYSCKRKAVVDYGYCEKCYERAN